MIDLQQTIKITTLNTQPFEGQKPGTSGLRKKVKEFQKPHYTQNFIQAYFNALRKDSLSPNNTLLVGGDGRYYSNTVIQAIIKIACSNGVDEIHIAKNGLMSTPACSAYIRGLNKQFGNCLGGILLTASHNPGGPDQDFGIKFNSRNGGPAQTQFTDLVYKETKSIKKLKTAQFQFLKIVDITTPGEYKFENVKRVDKPVFIVKVVENVQHYVELMREQFDFQAIKKLFSREDFRFVFDGMCGVAGPYAKALFEGEFKGNIKLMNCDNKEDFGGLHPDPNLKWAKPLVDLMGVGSEKPSQYDFGGACDGDADRNMILGKNFFVTPSDSLAMLTAHSGLILKSKLKGVARSMPTSGSVDLVAKKLGVDLYQTPTGWKFFGNLMEDGLISICGEESFGTGSTHVREKDGLWTILAWLQIIAKVNESTAIGKLKGIPEITNDFWKEYGRNYYCRYDFDCAMDVSNELWAYIESQIPKYQNQKEIKGLIFQYNDPVDYSVSKNQGIIFKYADGSRVIFRKSGTSTDVATIRIYFQKYNKKDLGLRTEEALQQIIKFGLEVSQIQKFTKKQNPDVIT